MNHIEINYEEISQVVSKLIGELETGQTEVSGHYSSLAGQFTESAGAEADALRSLQDTEKELMQELIQVLQKFGNSIRFAANEFRTLDQTGASKMTQEK